MYRNIQGSVIPRYFWKDEEQFDEIGLGYSLIYDGEIAATAFSAYKNGNQLEIGIETLEKYRGKGFAKMVCSALIDACLKSGLEPVWACRLENEGSYQLAQKLGFVPSVCVPYYKLGV
ncbi:GNAT acetyltransferase [compost metagenome]